ncbi:hypothetical protein B4N89_43860 [Embleya scabrispora]|uniref:Uncharacterized protein n=1 Tax=Embleya scabrispora TaxID=159449 RepID=A0A1T3NL03_9ACTN|nr:hypothetical protein B4N89_43860 [Embleya scabrispora]
MMITTLTSVPLGIACGTPTHPRYARPRPGTRRHDRRGQTGCGSGSGPGSGSGVGPGRGGSGTGSGPGPGPGQGVGCGGRVSGSTGMGMVITLSPSDHCPGSPRGLSAASVRATSRPSPARIAPDVSPTVLSPGALARPPTRIRHLDASSTRS